MRVLIADDSPVSRRLLQAPLEEWGYQVEIAHDGAQALALLECEDSPRLAILDWMMPEKSGLDVCRLVRRRGRHPYVYILLLTSRSSKEDIVEGMRAGADDYLVKPFDKHELEVRLRAGRRILDLQAQLISAQEALREQATRDSLTSLWNRRSILDVLETEISRADREATNLGLLMFDLDHFKSVNDDHGHLVGDVVLQQTAGRMRASMRKYDSVGRYGGEEFLAILPGVDESSIISQADRLRKSISDAPMMFASLTKAEARSVRVTVSVGATIILPGKRVTAEAAIHAADEALYIAKRSGRNCSVLVRITPEGDSTVFPVIQGALP